MELIGLNSFLYYNCVSYFNSSSENAFPCFLFILSCRMELTAYYRNRTFSNSQATCYSFSERCEAYHIACYPSTTHRNIFQTNKTCVKPIRYVLDHLDEWKLIWYGSRGRLVWIKIFAHCLVFVMFQRFFSSLALSPTQFTTFFLDGGSYVLIR